MKSDRPDRRTVLKASAASLAAGGLASLLGTSDAFARDRADTFERRLDERRKLAIHKACRYLAARQHPDGGFGDTNVAVVALTSLVVLALMAHGSTDGRGPYGEQVRKGIDFLVNLIKRRQPGLNWHEGYFYHPQDRSSRMHGQGFATLALATALGNSTGRRYREIKDVLQKAVACIEQAQTTSGGFGYDPVSGGEHEGSVTVTVAQGLRAAQDAGLAVNETIVKKGLNYLRNSQNLDGSFRYSLYVDRSSYALTAAALSSFFLYGKYIDSPGEHVIQRGLDYMMRRVTSVLSTGRWYYYGHFYAAWTCWQKDGDEWDPRRGGYWARWHREVYPDLLEKQRRADGGWSDGYDQFDFGDVLPTAFAILTLSIPDEVLPIFQR